RIPETSEVARRFLDWLTKLAAVETGRLGQRGVCLAQSEQVRKICRGETMFRFNAGVLSNRGVEWRRALLVLFVVSSALFVALNGAVSATGASTRPPAQASDTTENQAQARLAWMREHQTGMWNVAPSEGAFLRDEVVKVNAQRALEIGTSNGYSGIWIALGLRETGGHLITLEIDDGR